MEKRKRVVLSIEDKLKIIQRLEGGEIASKLAKEFGIGNQTVRDLKKKEKELYDFVASSDCMLSLKKRKTIKKSKFEDIDRAMYEWFCQQRALGVLISGPMIMEKANFFHKAMGVEGEFSASTGWLTRFKDRHGIREIFKGNKLSAEAEVVADFHGEFRRAAEERGLTLSHIYNDEEGHVKECQQNDEENRYLDDSTTSEVVIEERSKEIFKDNRCVSPEKLLEVRLSEDDDNDGLEEGIITHGKALESLQTVINYFKQKGGKSHKDMLHLYQYRCEIKENYKAKFLIKK